MKTTIYVPVYIEGKEENLPKEDGEYIICQDNRVWCVMFIAKFSEITKDYWMDITYWLKPVELPDDKEINNEANKYGGLVKENIDGNCQDYGVEENASLDFLRGSAWFKSQILNK